MVWASAKGRYAIERWNPLTGAMLARVPVKSPWFVESANYPSNNKIRPKPIIETLWESDGLMWVLIRDADTSWKSDADPERAWSPTRDNAIFDWVLEVVEPASGNVLVSRRFDFVLFAHAPQPLVASYTATRVGETGGLDVWRPELRLRRE
jgi:hypothetical protein